jgi:hypothetical protein
MSYVDYEYYSTTYGGTIITAEDAPKLLQNASNTVDILTYCRIVSRGLEACTDFQKHIIQQVVCALAEWQSENADILNNPYNSYSINGVTATWGNSVGVRKINGVLIPNTIYSELIKTGLCYAGV